MSVTTPARAGEYLVPERARHAYCRSCGATIVWTKTTTGHAIPLDLATAETRDGARWALTHFAICPDARGWRRNGAEVVKAAPAVPAAPDPAAAYRLADGTLPVAWWRFRQRHITNETCKWLLAPSQEDVARELAALAEQETEGL